MTFLLATLAVWRVTHLIALEVGPFDFMAKLRHKAGHGFWGTLLDCFYCLSLWVAIPFAYWLADLWREWVVYWLALSAAAIVMNRACDRFLPEMPLWSEAPIEPPKNDD